MYVYICMYIKLGLYWISGYQILSGQVSPKIEYLIYKMCWRLFTYLIIWGGVHLFVLCYSHFWWLYFKEILTSPVEILRTSFSLVIRDSRSPMNELGTHWESKLVKMLWNVAKYIRTGRDHYKNISVYLESPTLLSFFVLVCCYKWVTVLSEHIVF